MAIYRYLAADLITNTILAELPLSESRFDLRLNGAGSFAAKLQITDLKVKALPFLAATEPGRTALYVERDGVLLWGGILWTRRSANGGIELGGLEFESYFARRLITMNAVFTAVDQLTIARSLISTAQGVSGGSIAVNLDTSTSGVLRDRTYNGYELKPVLEALQQLSAVDNGFDYAIDVAYVAGVPTKTLNLGYPRRGARAGSSGFVFEYPGNVQSYVWPEDATSQATTSYATGAGTGPGQMLAASSRADLITAGYPLLEGKFSYIDVIVQSTLQAHADGDVKALGAPIVVPQITVRADLDPVVGSYMVGDEIRLRITDDRFANATTAAGLDTYKRIIAIAVTPPGSGAETVTLTLGDIV